MKCEADVAGILDLSGNLRRKIVLMLLRNMSSIKK